MRIITFILVAWCGLFGVCGIALAQDQITIGGVLPLTGDAQNFGREAQMALEHALADTSVKRFKYKLVFEDDQLNPAKAALAARKLADVDNVKVIFSNWSYGGHAVASAVKGREIINFAFAWDKAVLDAGENNFVSGPPPSLLAGKIVSRVLSEGAKSALILGFQEAGVVQAFNEVELAAKQQGLNILDRIEIPPGEVSGIGAIVAKIKGRKPDYIIACLLFPQYVELFKQMQLQKYDVPVGGIGQTPYDLSFKSIVPKKWWSIDFQAGPADSEKIQKRTGLRNLSGYPAYYDAMKAVVETYEKAPEGSMPSQSWIIEQLGKYRSNSALLGQIAIVGRRIDSKNAIFVEQTERYK